MEKIMDLEGIYVNEGKTRFPYRRIFSKSIPNYYPSEEKQELYKDMNIDEILFLPIRMSEFVPDPNNRFVGFRYLFQTVGHSTISIGKDPGLVGVTMMQLSASVVRFRYYIKDKNEIVIDKVCAPLVPPRVFDIDSPSIMISSQVNKIISSIVNQWNEWYIDKEV